MDGRYVAAQDRVDRNEPPTPGSFLLDAGVEVELRSRRLRPALRLAVLNIADSRYYGHLSRYRILNLPEPGRNWTVGFVLPVEAN
jgi:iron complex outermembrane receptor protein